MPSFSISGIATGLPADLVDQLVAVQQRPLEVLADKKIEQQTRLAAVQDLNAKLLTMKSTMEGLDAPEDFQGRSATSSDTSFVTLSASGNAAVGHHVITNVVLANNDQLRHTTGVTSKTDPLAGGTFAFTYAGGTEQQVSISGGETLVDLADKINTLKSGVTATLINDGTSDYLMLTGDDTGTSKSIAITVNTTLTGFEAADFTDNSIESDASFKLGGLAIVGASNTFTGAVEGVTINLQKATAGEQIDLTVAKDPSTIKSKVKAFVDAYNTVATTLKAHSEFDPKTGRRTVLFGDAAVRGIESQLRRIITTPIDGGTAPWGTLAELGVTTDRSSSLLTIDDAKLSAAIDLDYGGVGSLFYNDVNAGTEGFAKQMMDYLAVVTNPATGVMDGKVKTVQTQLDALDRQIGTTQRRVDLASDRLRRQFASLETLVSNLQSSTTGALASLQNLANTG